MTRIAFSPPRPQIRPYVPRLSLPAPDTGLAETETNLHPVAAVAAVGSTAVAAGVHSKSSGPAERTPWKDRSFMEAVKNFDSQGGINLAACSEDD